MSSGRSSADAPRRDPFAVALWRGVVSVVGALEAVEAPNQVVVIDGQSGAGKSSLSRALVAHWPHSGRVQVVALDSLYPGWDGLDEGARIVRDDVLIPHARGLIGVWQRWDWSESAPAEAHAVDPSLPLIVEGSGALDSRTARLADVRVWMDAPQSSRRRRALDRDGDAFRPHWERWARQEERHIDRDAPRSHASIVVSMP